MDRATTRALQSALLRLGYRLPRYGADGYWGGETRLALAAYLADRDRLAEGDVLRTHRPPAALVAEVVAAAHALPALLCDGTPRVAVLGCDVSGHQDPAWLDLDAFHAAGGRAIYIALTEAKIRKRHAEAHFARVRAWNAARGLTPEDDDYIRPGPYHFVNVSYSARARTDAEAVAQATWFADHVLAEGAHRHEHPETTGRRPGDLPPAFDFEHTRTWESKPIAAWLRRGADTLRARLRAAGEPERWVLYGFGYSLVRLVSQDWSDAWVWIGASPHVVVPRYFPEVHVKQVVTRQPWIGGRKVDTDTFRVPLRTFCGQE